MVESGSRARRPGDACRARPSVSIIIPVAPGENARAADAPRQLDYARDRIELLVEHGVSPAAQRNAAAAVANGEYLLFLDDDSRVTPGLLRRYVTVLEGEPRIAAAGGPAIYESRSLAQRAFTAALASALVVGRTASRYTPRGRSRDVDERELILCNLCVRRGAFESAGGFNEKLFPNEENELLDRLQAAGWRLSYCPGAIVYREQRTTLRRFLSAMLRYGRGRGAQFRTAWGRTNVVRAALASLALSTTVATLAAATVSGSLVWTAPLLGYSGYLALVGATIARRCGVLVGSVAALVAGLTHATYATGVIVGLLLRRRPATATLD